MSGLLDTKVCVLGGGVAAGYFAKAYIEAGGPQKIGALTIINEQPTLPYERPAISKGYLTKLDMTVDKFYTAVATGGEPQNREWYDKHGISFLPSTTVTGIDFLQRRVRTAGGPTINYQKLVLATGSEARKLGCSGEDLKGVIHLRESGDAEAIRSSYADCRARGGKACIVGGGYIGLEVSAGLRQNGLDVTLVYPTPRILENLFPAELAEKHYEKYYREKGVKLQGGALKTVGFRGDDQGRVAAVQLEDGSEIKASLVLVAVGARPRVDLFEGTGLEVDKEGSGGVVVDGHLRSRAFPDVYAVGDVASFPLKLYGVPRHRNEHVQNARESGQHAARHIVDPSIPVYDYLPFFYSRGFDLSWKFYGDQSPKEQHIVGNMDPYLCCIWRSDDKRLAGILLESKGDDQYVPLMQKLARARPVMSDEALKAFQMAGADSVPAAMMLLEMLVQ